MPSTDRIAALQDELVALRHDLHAHPELLYDVHRTAGIVAETLKAYGCDEVVTGIGRTGVVAVIRGHEGGSGRVVGLRADMDALPIEETTNLPWRSTVPGKMHACGHDGHTAMLLGAARYLAETRDFAGTAVLIFQPAEEGGGGGLAMLDDRLMERFGITEVYGMHNMPGIPLGHFSIRPGPMMAAADRFTIRVEGRGAHAAKPHEGIDPVVAACHIVTALQSIVSRAVNPVDSAVVSVTTVQAGSAFNIIPQTATMSGTVRTLSAKVRDLCEARVKHVAVTMGEAFGVSVQVDYGRGYPVTVNHAEQTGYAVAAAERVAGAGKVRTDPPPSLGAEDFSFMLEARPGAYIFMGNGDSAGLHHPAYDFNDAAIPLGVAYWAALVETRMPRAG